MTFCGAAGRPHADGASEGTSGLPDGASRSAGAPPRCGVLEPCALAGAAHLERGLH